MNATVIAQSLNTIQALIGWIVARGVSRDRIQIMLDEAARNGTDLTSETVQTELDVTASELLDTENLINNQE